MLSLSIILSGSPRCPAFTALLTMSSETWRTTSEGFGSRRASEKQICHPRGSERNWLRKSNACDLRDCSARGFHAISMAFLTYVQDHMLESLGLIRESSWLDVPVHPYRPLKEHLEAYGLYASQCLLSKLPASLTGKALGLCYRVIDAGAVRICGTNLI